MTKNLKQVRKEWYGKNGKLAKSGFVDIEAPAGHLKKHNTRTAAWESREATAEFYAMLDAYLLVNTNLNRLQRKILELYATGEKLSDIAYAVYRSLAYVKNVIYRHRDIILHVKK